MHASPTINSHDWRTIAPLYDALLAEELTPARIPDWLRRWSDLQQQVWEARAGLKRDRSRDVTNAVAQQAFERFVEGVFSPFHVANHALTEKLLALPDYEPAPEQREMLRVLRSEAALFHAENVAIESQIGKLTGAYNTLVGSMTTRLDGQELDGPTLKRLAQDRDRTVREAAWHAESVPWLAARDQIDQLFSELLIRRHELAHNAGLTNYHAYRWQQLARLDYTPADALAFHDAIVAEVVPLATQLMERRRIQIGVDRLRPWDLEADPDDRPLLRPFSDVRAFEAGMAGVFTRIDPELGTLFERMRAGFLDLGWRKGKMSGGEEWLFPVTGLPYVRTDADGSGDGVNLLLHEMGHAFHDYLALTRQRLHWHLSYPDEVAEFAAISMTHLAAPFLRREQGGFYTDEEAKRAHNRLLQTIITTWLPTIALHDAFQHWVYTQPPEEFSPAACEAQWQTLAARFTPWIDWTGLEAEHGAGWQRIGLMFTQPFYMIEYGLAHLGALQVWRNAQANPQAAWHAYRTALALGATQSLPELYATAGARLPFEREVVQEVVSSVAVVLDTSASTYIRHG